MALQDYCQGRVVPKTLFHGTRSRFEAFDERFLGLACRNPTTLFGFYFSETSQDAMHWAGRGRGGLQPPSVIEVALDVSKLIDMSYADFHYFLQRARKSTIAKRRLQWIKEGWDGFTVLRENTRWFCIFESSKIHIQKDLSLIHI